MGRMTIQASTIRRSLMDQIDGRGGAGRAPLRGLYFDRFEFPG
jgi:hypothetical protein